MWTPGDFLEGKSIDILIRQEALEEQASAFGYIE